MTWSSRCSFAPTFFAAALGVVPVLQATASSAGDLGAASSSPSLSSSGVTNASDDATISSRVKIKLLSDEQLTGASINVSTSYGVVLLRGIVRSADAAEEATQVAQSVNGVKAVDNQLTTPALPNRLAARTSGPASSVESDSLDSRINLKLRDALLTDSELRNTEIGISSTNGVVRLFGQVQSDTQRDHAGQVAREIYGVRDVDLSGLAVTPSP